MKRRRSSEALSDILQFETEGPSSDLDKHGKPLLEPKHKIFLSHSGAQKCFTEQLCKDLERVRYFPFFDRRSHSLPKGENFPELIFQAAQQCQVAVLILSQEYFVRSKWPMLELEAFVESRKDQNSHITILPVYFRISRHECICNSAKRAAWLSVWRDWSISDRRINVSKWTDALEVLDSPDCIEHGKAVSEVALREQIVARVCNLIPPEYRWVEGHVQGRSYLCKAILQMLERTRKSPVYGVRVVGVYGICGIGKTTICKALCNDLFAKFGGKICHAELGSRNGSGSGLLKEVLWELTTVDYEVLSWLCEDKINDQLRSFLHRQPVFLALDNVSEETFEEAKVLLTAGFHLDSIVMVAARTVDILSRLNIDRSDCLEMPELEEEDARELFLHHAVRDLHVANADDKWIIDRCIAQCRFRKGKKDDEHYLPLALEVLGTELRCFGYNPRIWLENLSKGKKFNCFRGKDHPIFSRLRIEYDALTTKDQLLFMDVALYLPNRSSAMGDLNNFEWLSIVHRSEVSRIKDRLKGLKAKSLVEDIGDGFSIVKMHDLFREFATVEAKSGVLDSRRWIHHDGKGYPIDLEKTPPGNCWSEMERISIKYQKEDDMESMKGVNWQHFSNVVVLQLRIGRGEVLNLDSLHCLRSLDVKWGGEVGGGVVGLGKLKYLAWLRLWNMHCASCFEEMDRLSGLVVVILRSWCKGNSCKDQEGHVQLLEPPHLDKCIRLQEFHLESKYLTELPDSSKFSLMRRANFANCRLAKAA